MGYRLHVAKKYQIEYSVHSGFNHRNDDFIQLLDMFDVDRYNLSCVDYADDIFEVEKDQFGEMLDNLKAIRNNEYELDEDEYDEFKGIIKNLSYSEEYSQKCLNEVISILQSFYDEADKNSEYILFAWY